jgi:hypothetical protein
MGGAHHRRVHLAGQREIVPEPSPPPEQALILLAPQRLADHVDANVLTEA